MVVAVSCGGDVLQWHGLGVRVEGKMNELLDKNLLQSIQNLRLGQRFTFHQDNDPKHTAKTTQEWLQYKSLNILEF